jgi:hypothetical protein
MKKIILLCLFVLVVASNVLADDKPKYYDNWEVKRDDILKKTTLIKKGHPTGDWISGMGDTLSGSQLQYSFEAIFVGKPGDVNRKINYYLLFDNIVNQRITDKNPMDDHWFKYTPSTEVTMVLDDDSQNLNQDYHSGEYGDAFIGMSPYEEIRVALAEDIMNKILAAKTVAFNLSSDDKDANKSFVLDQKFKDVLKAFLYRVKELK